jgi:hypothetical protein
MDNILPEDNIIAIPLHQPDVLLRGYKAIDRNVKLEPTKPPISDEAIIGFLNTNKLIYCNVEIYFDIHMPTREFRLFSQNISDFDILKNIVSSLKCFIEEGIIFPNIEEIHVTPVYQKIEGFPKIFTDTDQSISILLTMCRIIPQTNNNLKIV